MIFPPSLLRVQVQGTSHRVGLWLPLLLAWPPVLLIGAALFPFILGVSVLTWRNGWGKALLLAALYFYRLFCALRGLRIEVENPSQHVYINFK